MAAVGLRYERDRALFRPDVATRRSEFARRGPSAARQLEVGTDAPVGSWLEESNRVVPVATEPEAWSFEVASKSVT